MLVEMIVQAFKTRKGVSGHTQEPPDHCRGYIYCYLKITDNNLTVLYPTPLLTKELSTTPNQPLGSNTTEFFCYACCSVAKL